MTTIKTEFSDGVSSVQGITVPLCQAGLDLPMTGAHGAGARVAGRRKGSLMAISRNWAGETKGIGFRA